MHQSNFAINFTLSLFCLIIIGCQQMQNQMTTEPDDTKSVSVDDIEPVDMPNIGNVFIGEADDRFGNDEFALNSATIIDDTLEISVSYSGGCKNHKFTLIASETFLESFPVQLHISLAHDAMGDTCEAYPTENYLFDLTPLKNMYQEAYREDTGTIVLRLEDFDDELTYTF